MRAGWVWNITVQVITSRLEANNCHGVWGWACRSVSEVAALAGPSSGDVRQVAGNSTDEGDIHLITAVDETLGGGEG